MAEYKLSVRQSCKLLQISRASYYSRAQDNLVKDKSLIDCLQEIVSKHVSWGFWKCYNRLRMNGHLWNHKRVYRVYCSLGLNQARRKKKRLPPRQRQSMEVAPEMNRSWSMDFMQDALYNGRRFRALNILDEGVREGLGIEIDTSLPSQRVIRALE